MEDFAVMVLWITSLLLPALIFLAADRFKSLLATATVALIAIGIGWAFMLAYAVAAQCITANGPAQVNGAALAFADVFGWVLPAVVVVVTWLTSRAVLRVAGRSLPVSSRVGADHP